MTISKSHTRTDLSLVFGAPDASKAKTDLTTSNLATSTTENQRNQEAVFKKPPEKPCPKGSPKSNSRLPKPAEIRVPEKPGLPKSNSGSLKSANLPVLRNTTKSSECNNSCAHKIQLMESKILGLSTQIKELKAQLLQQDEELSLKNNELEDTNSFSKFTENMLI